MSKKENVTEQTAEKVLTKYDRKMQKRQEQKEQEKREKRRSTIIGVVIAVVLVCFIASFPIRSYMVLNNAFIKVNGQDVSQVEYDYYYGSVYNEYAGYLSYFGVDMDADLSTQMYTEELSWKDYFDELAINKMKQNKSLLAKAKEEGFTYDTTEEYDAFVESIKAQAGEYGVSVNDYMAAMYGSYATLDRVEAYIKNDFTASAFYEQKIKDFEPTEEEIQAYYESNSSAVDSVDYRVTIVEAEFAEGATEEELSKAMETALAKAEETEKTIMTEGELQENVTFDEAYYLINEWLFDEARKKGDTTVVEQADSYRYYVVGFEQRYLAEIPTVDARILTAYEQDGQALLDEWKSGEATEESFSELCKNYSTDDYTEDGGLRVATVAENFPEDVSAWLFDEARVAGDTVSVTVEDTTYVMYFVAKNDLQWKLKVKDTISNEKAEEFLNEISENVSVEDPKGNLKYLKTLDEIEASLEAE